MNERWPSSRAGAAGSAGPSRSSWPRTGIEMVITYKANDEAAAETLRLIREAGGSGEALKFDVGNAAEAEARLNDLLARLERIDALVNNAGITADGLFLMMPRKDWNSVIDTSLGGFYNMTKPVLRKMLRRKKRAPSSRCRPSPPWSATGGRRITPRPRPASSPPAASWPPRWPVSASG